MAKENKKVYTINVLPSIMAKFDKKAKENKRSRSGELEMALEGYLKEVK